MEQARSNWNDDRLDALSGRVDDRFDVVDQRFDHVEKNVDQRFEDVDRRFGEVNQRLDRQSDHFEHRFNAIDASLQQIHRSMFVGLASILAAFVGLFATLQL